MNIFSQHYSKDSCLSPDINLEFPGDKAIEDLRKSWLYHSYGQAGSEDRKRRVQYELTQTGKEITELLFELERWDKKLYQRNTKE
jgi:hypothetical protein